MPTVLELKNIDKGKPSYSGHVGYPGAKYIRPGHTPLNIIYKENKHANPQFSRLEVSFSHLVGLFLGKDATPLQRLVVNNLHEVTGLAIEHMCYVIDKKKEVGRKYYKLTKPWVECGLEDANVSATEQIPLYFLDKLPQAFFADLIQKKDINIDFDSLARIFTASYTLEEDDLHKGNFGFYIVEKDGKPTAVFFKIDHDLMFVDSIMSFFSPRFFHLNKGARAFNITADDLRKFPDLHDSANSYWPTKKCVFPSFSEEKEFRSDREVQCFAHLAAVPEFVQAKWKYFYKHILIPADLVQKELGNCLDQNVPEERAQIALLTEAVVARQARLRAVLFSMPEFRDFVSKLSDDDKRHLLIESTQNESHYFVQAQTTMQQYDNLCANCEEGDTPLHVAIKFGDYRYEESMQSFGEFINYRNNSGKLPIDIAQDRASLQIVPQQDIRQDARFTMKHLLQHESRVGAGFAQFNEKESIETYVFQTHHLVKVDTATGYQDLKMILREVGEDYSYCLKLKKKLAIKCIAQFIENNKDRPGLKNILLQLRRDIDGESPEVDAAPVKYIRQLRSKLWIIRQIRGLYGYSSTQGVIDELIEKELQRIKSPSCFPFASDEIDPAYYLLAFP